ncbi:MAG: MobA/MobL family protein [Simkania negevensis]|nr:MobA/MobL family protein [Simkania negevensis]
MAIGFARLEFVQRSKGRNSCHKAAYNAREKLSFEGNCALDPETYDFSSRESPAHHEILLPKGANKRFNNLNTLWNTAEAQEKKTNSQVALELVLALPDDKEIDLQDRIFLARSFIQKEFTDKGLAAQLDIHPPERLIEFTRSYEELNIKKGKTGLILEEKEGIYTIAFGKSGTITSTVTLDSKQFNDFAIQEHNWHAHILCPTRRFKANGQEFADTKARDLLPQVRNGRVISGPDWGTRWAQHQNEYFQTKGLALRVDDNSLVPQEHLGPVRLRARAFALMLEHERRLELNAIQAQNPKNILEAITKKQSVFTKEDVNPISSNSNTSKHMPTLLNSLPKKSSPKSSTLYGSQAKCIKNLSPPLLTL